MNPKPVEQPKEWTESEVRKLRDNVFCRPISDEAWEAVKSNWMKPAEMEWLLSKQSIAGGGHNDA